MSHPYEADAVYVNAVVHTMDPAQPEADAFAVRDGRITAVGAASDLHGLAAPSAVVDLAGQTVIPGLTDAHTHLAWASDSLNFWTGIHVPPYGDIPSLLGRLREAAAGKAAGEWILGMGNLMHEQRLAERRYPTRRELDTVSTDHPILLRLAGHVHVLNSLAIERMNIPDDVVAPPQGHIGREADGSLDGVFLDAHHVLTLPAFDQQERVEAIAQAARHYFLRFGITAIGDIVSDAWQVRAFQDLKARGLLPLRIGYYPVVPDAVRFDSVLDFSTSSGLGDDSLYFAGLKVFADGGVSAKQGAMHEPYRGTEERGGLGYEEAEFRAIVRACLANRIQLVTHAAGDRSFDFVLDAYEGEIPAAGWDDHRFRVEHVSHPYLTDERIARLRDSGSVGVPQAPHLYSMGDFYAELLGDEKLPLALRLRSMIDQGLTIPGSSDLTGSQPESSNPFLGMWTSVEREAVFGTKYGTSEAITPYEALRSYTIDSAHAINQDHVRGSISAGKLADFAVLDRDLLAIPTGELRDVTVRRTFIGGTEVYSAD